MRFDLVVPGLLPALAAFSPAQLESLYPALFRFLSKSSGSPETVGYFALISKLFGVAGEQPGALPMAALAARQLGHTDGYWIMARPVYLFPDRDCLLMKQPFTRLEEHHLAQLAGLLKEAAPDLVEAIYPFQQTLLIRLSRCQNLLTHSFLDAIGKNIEPYLPEGDDRSVWQVLSNEMQMLIYQQPGLVEVVNALWFEGAGDTAMTTHTPVLSELQASDAVTLAAASALGATIRENAVILPDANAASHRVLIETGLLWSSHPDRLEGAAQTLKEVDRWLVELVRQVQTGKIGTLQLHTLDGYRFSLNRWNLLRFWRRFSLPGRNAGTIDSRQ